MISLSSFPSTVATSSTEKQTAVKCHSFSFRHKCPDNYSLTMRCRAEMASSTAYADAEAPSTLPSLPDKRIMVGCGAINVDFLATVATFPKLDDKIRSTSLKVQGGGNTGNTSTCAARLGLTPRVISKVANDAQGRSILEELKADGVDTSYIVVSEEGNSPFTYVIVDNETKSRTCIHTPGHPVMIPADLSQSRLISALDGARIVYFDGRLHETALVVAKEHLAMTNAINGISGILPVQATCMQIPILVDAERKREGLDDLLNLADYAVCSAKFPVAWTEAQSVPSALVSMMLRLPQLKFVIVTLGENGCIMLERNLTEHPESEEIDVNELLESLKQRITTGEVIPTCISSKSMMRLNAAGIGTVSGRLLVGTAEKIPDSELIDSTGAGDAFIGSVLYGMTPEKMLPFAAQVAAAGCRALGAWTGLPRRTDPRLAPFLV